MVTAVTLLLASQEAFLSVVSMRTNTDERQHAAVARIEIYQDGHRKYTDFLSFYRFPEGWRVMEKIFHYYPKE